MALVDQIVQSCLNKTKREAVGLLRHENMNSVLVM